MSGVQTAQHILGLARSKDRASRERLMLSLADLCEAGMRRQDGRDPAIEHLLNSVFGQLIVQAEHDIRMVLAQRLADTEWAPHELIVQLAGDDIDVARPVIAASPLLSDDDLCDILRRLEIEHQIEVARRPGIGETVVDLIVYQAQPAVLTALCDNDTADISGDAMARLVEASREIAAMRSPLVRHPKLSLSDAERLYAFVGESLKQAIAGRYRVDPKVLDRAVADAVGQASSQFQFSAMAGHDAERRRMERQLVAKLNIADQLKPGYLIRALREQRLTLFVAGVAELSGLDYAAIEASIHRDRPDLLALACTACQMDRGAFPTILALIRQLANGHPISRADADRKALQAFAIHDRDLAATAFESSIAKARQGG